MCVVLQQQLSIKTVQNLKRSLAFNRAEVEFI